MSGWDQWVTFMHGTAANTYADKKGADNSPATWYISIGDQGTGDTWDKTSGFPLELAPADCAAMGKASTGEDQTIFSTPPKGITIVNSIDFESIKVLAAKGKGEPGGRQIFCAYSTTTLIIAVCDIQNTNKGCEIAALDAFGDAVVKCIENNI